MCLKCCLLNAVFFKPQKHWIPLFPPRLAKLAAWTLIIGMVGWSISGIPTLTPANQGYGSYLILTLWACIFKSIWSWACGWSSVSGLLVTFYFLTAQRSHSATKCFMSTNFNLYNLRNIQRKSKFTTRKSKYKSCFKLLPQATGNNFWSSLEPKTVKTRFQSFKIK